MFCIRLAEKQQLINRDWVQPFQTVESAVIVKNVQLPVFIHVGCALWWNAISFVLKLVVASWLDFS